jgi:SAM-dependent methyltransferase
MYEVLAGVYDPALADDFQPVILARLEQALESHGLPAQRRLLDLGCGTGTLACEMAGRGWQVTGLDASPPMLERARAKAADRAVTVEWVEGDMRRFRPEGRFGLAVSFYDTLNHLLTNADLMRTLRNAHASLEPDGLFAFDVNNRLAFWNLWGDPEPFEAEVDGALLRISTTFDRASRVGEAEVEVRAAAGVRRETIRQRFFSDTEIRGLLLAEGFEVLEARDFAAFPSSGPATGQAPAGVEEEGLWKDHPDPEKVKTFWMVRKAAR